MRAQIIRKLLYLCLLIVAISIGVFNLFLSPSKEQEQSKAVEVKTVQGNQKSVEELLAKGRKLREEGKFEEAREIFESGVTLAEQAGNLEGQVESLFHLGDICWNQGDLTKSEEFYRQAYDLACDCGMEKWVERGNYIFEIFDHYNQGKILRAKQDYPGSVTSFKLAISQAEAINSPDHVIKCLRQLSVTYWGMFDFENFYRLNLQALDLARKINLKREIGQCLNNIGFYFWRINDYTRALSHYFEALEIAQELGNLSQQSACLNNIGTIYDQFELYDRSSEILMNSLSRAKITNDNETKITVLLNLGVNFFNRLKKNMNKSYMQDSIYFSTEALDLSKKIGNKYFSMIALNNLGFIYLEKGNYNNSIRYLNDAINYANDLNDIGTIAVILNNLGLVYLKKGEIAQAKKYFSQAISLKDQILNGEVFWEAYYGLGKCLEKEGNSAKAIYYYEKSINQVEEIRNKIALDIFKTSFSKDKHRVYEDWINLIYHEYEKNPDENNLERAFQAVERAKAQAFLESLNISQRVFQERLPTKLREEERNMNLQFSQVLGQLALPNLGEEQKAKLLEDYKELEEKYMIHLIKIREAVPETRLSQINDFPVLREVKKMFLNKKVALLEYFLGNRFSLLFIISKDEKKIIKLPGEQEIVNSIRGYLKLLSDQPISNFQGILAAQRIYHQLLEKAMESLSPEIKYLIIIPDGLLHYLPFEALVFPSGKYLGEKYSISYSPSTSSLLYLCRRSIPHNNKVFMAFGSPKYKKKKLGSELINKSTYSLLLEIYKKKGFKLASLPFSQKEVKRISRFFPKEYKKIYLGDKATESILKKEKLDNVLILHFACHGFLDEEVPLRSAIVLSPEEELNEDGFFQVREIYGLSFSAEMVVLSACQTARGTLEKSEGVLGLPRSFFYSGARSVVSSLWDVSDKSTAEFMENFYHFLSEGKPKIEALQLAKIKMLKKYAHPHYWAAFVLNGEPFSSIKFN